MSRAGSMPPCQAVYAAKYLQIPAVGLWTFAGPGSMVGLVHHFLMQSGNIEVAEILRQAREFEPMMEAIRNCEEKYGVLDGIHHETYNQHQPAWKMMSQYFLGGNWWSFIGTTIFFPSQLLVPLAGRFWCLAVHNGRTGHCWSLPRLRDGLAWLLGAQGFPPRVL